jgi:adenine-specific DNA-methyltransferase
MLAIHKKGVNTAEVRVNQITTLPQNKVFIRSIGVFSLSNSIMSPWILPRSPEQVLAVKAMEKMLYRLSDWGYQVSTGPLVWNRHKSQLTNKSGKKTYPIIWAEAITSDGRFVLKAEKANHKAYFRYRRDDDWLVNRKPCILLQRTTAKEQGKRLIAAPLPDALRKNGSVIENHLNMIIAINGNPVIPPRVLSAFLNSTAVNDAFRAISGSVAISAYELEALPLPPPERLNALSNVLLQGGDFEEIESICKALYN